MANGTPLPARPELWSSGERQRRRDVRAAFARAMYAKPAGGSVATREKTEWERAHEAALAGVPARLRGLRR
jgi:hypothetical protein